MKLKFTFLSLIILLSALTISCKKNYDDGFYVSFSDVNIGKALIDLKIDDAQDRKQLQAKIMKMPILKFIGKSMHILQSMKYFVTVGVLNYNTDNNIIRDVVANRKIGVPTKFILSKETNQDYVDIPDINFEKALIALKIDDVEDGVLLVENALNVTSLNVKDRGISDLKGIEAFVNLKVLNCSSNPLKNLDVSKNLVLTELSCNENKLTNLDVSKNLALMSLDCYENDLTKLDLTKNSKLVRLSCGDNSLRSLDVSKNLALTTLNCYRNYLSSLYVNKNIKLKVLYCSDNTLNNLDVSKNIALTELGCSDNGLRSLDVSKNLALIHLYCGTDDMIPLPPLQEGDHVLIKTNYARNRLTTLDVSKNLFLERLDCSNNQLKALGMSKNIKLIEVWCSKNQLRSMDVRKNTKLLKLFCYANKIQTICVNSLSQPTSNWQKDDSASYKVCQ